MQSYWTWWGLAVLLGVLELITGTLYLLVLALGIAAGGLLAFLGASFAWQLMAAAAVSFAGWFLLRRYGPRRARAATHGGRDMQLDVGERVRVEHWRADRRAQVSYRGATWEAELEPSDNAEPAPGEHVIRRIEGSRLIVART